MTGRAGETVVGRAHELAVDDAGRERVEVARSRSAADELRRVAARFQSRALTASATLAEGRVRLAEGDPADGVRLCSEAARLWNEVGAPYEAAVARMALAAALRAAGRRDQAELEAAAARAELRRIEAVHSSGAADAGERPAADASTFRREADYWSIVYEGSTIRVRDAKGMRYLARLLAQPGREVHALDLVAAEAGAAPDLTGGRAAGRAQAAPGDAGEMLDAQAKRAYRRRLAEIEDDIEQARALGDAEREAQADDERAFLARELSRAVGLGGDDRRASSDSERARVAVTRALRQAIARIGEHDRRLGEHLGGAVRTGTRCAYRPDPRDRVEWRL
jgi:hypothetical protein